LARPVVTEGTGTAIAVIDAALNTMLFPARKPIGAVASGRATAAAEMVQTALTLGATAVVAAPVTAGGSITELCRQTIVVRSTGLSAGTVHANCERPAGFIA
jgi:hypothetical protein